MTTLDVWLYGHRAGTLERLGDALRFAYADSYVAANGPPLSRSLPVSGDFDDRAAATFFANLLPEGKVRTLIARRLGVSVGNDFGLLYEIGGDCAGAVTLLPSGDKPPDLHRAPEVRWLDDEALAATLTDLPRRPLLANPEEGIRLSLAGAQDKLPVVVEGDRIGVPLRETPSTHIVKAAIAPFDGTIANEA